MLVRNIHSVPVFVAGLSIPPGRIGDVPREMWRDWLKASEQNRITATKYLVLGSDLAPKFAPQRSDREPLPEPEPVFEEVEDDQEEEPQDEDAPVVSDAAPLDTDGLTVRQRRIDSAIASLDPSDVALWTSQGVPKLAAIRRMEGLSNVSATELETATERLNAGNAS